MFVPYVHHLESSRPAFVIKVKWIIMKNNPNNDI